MLDRSFRIRDTLCMSLWESLDDDRAAVIPDIDAGEVDKDLCNSPGVFLIEIDTAAGVVGEQAGNNICQPV